MEELKKLLVPLDGSKLAEIVLPFTKQIAVRLGLLEVIFLNVCDSRDKELASAHQDYVQRVANNLKQQLQEVGRRIEARGKVIIGHPAEEIIDYAHKNQIDLICIATHGHSGFTRWAFGSVADKVLRASKVPIWLIRAASAKDIDYDKWPGIVALVLLDGSAFAESILPYIEVMVRQSGVEIVDIVLIRVCEPPTICADYPEGLPTSWDENVNRVTDVMTRASKAYLTGVEKRLKDTGFKVRSEVLIGNPTDEIIKYAANIPNGLIAMTTHGYSGVIGWAYGSVAQRVLERSSNPVLLVRPHQ